MVAPVSEVIDITQTLAFHQGDKHIVFTPHIKKMGQDILSLTNHGDYGTSNSIGKLLEFYLKDQNTPLIETFEWVKEQRYYDRFMLFGSKEQELTVMALIWPQRTFSPVHYHQAWCIFGVYEGALTEIIYAPSGEDVTPKAQRHYPKHAWAHDSSYEDYYHKLGNAEESPAISFHIYGVSPDNLHKINCIVR